MSQVFGEKRLHDYMAASHAIGITRIYDSLLDEMRGRNPDYQLFAPIITLKQKKSNRKGLTSYLIGRYIKATGRVDAGSSTTSNRYLHRICIPVRFKIEVALIKKVIMKAVIESPQVRTIEEKGKYILRCLFEKFNID